MARIGKNPCCAGVRSALSARQTSKQLKKLIVLSVLLAVLSGTVYAQVDFPAGDFWALDAGVGMSNFLVKGASYQFILDPRLWLSPPLMVGSKLGVNYAVEDEQNKDSIANSDILTFEGQVYLRWNFLRLGKDVNKQFNIFAQVGAGMVAAYRGDANPFDNVTETRGSLMADAAFGVTIPITERWHIEPEIRAGYPHLWGFSLTAGYKFKLPEKTRYIQSDPRVVYREVIRTVPAPEIARRIKISSVEFIIFGPDIGKYNLGVDQDGQSLNELVLNATAKFLKENPAYLVRLEGHANPVTTDPREADELMTLSTLRANTVAEKLKELGVSAEQLVVMAFGGTRTVTDDRERWDMNRRVELMIMQVDTDAE